MTRIVAVRAYVVRGGGADYHDQVGGHWIDDHIATPMARFPEYRESRSSFGLDVLGSVVVEVEADDGGVGWGLSTGGDPAAWIVEKHLARFVEGRSVAGIDELEEIWEQMFLSTVFYGRKGLVVNAISAVDLALWDLLGKSRGEPVHELLGGAVREQLVFYATGPRPDLAQKLGFIGGKLPLLHGPSEGDEGFEANLAQLAEMRQRVGDDFWLMWDCWMSLDLEYAVRLAEAGAEYGLRWLEEPLLPDDYWGYGELKRRLPESVSLTGGEHEWTRWGFRLLTEIGCCDILQPDVNWCGGLTELRRIAAAAALAGKLVVPHGSSVYSYHFVATQPHSPFAEFLMMHPNASEVVPMFTPLLIDEPVPVGGTLRLDDRPGFGVTIDTTRLSRPHTH